MRGGEDSPAVAGWIARPAHEPCRKAKWSVHWFMLSLMLGLTAATTTVDAHIVAVSMFKNGYAVVMRDLPVSGPGQYDLTSYPQAALGTLWFAGSEGVNIDAIRTVTKNLTTTANVGTTDQILQANIGRQITLGLGAGDAVTGR